MKRSTIYVFQKGVSLGGICSKIMQNQLGIWIRDQLQNGYRML